MSFVKIPEISSAWGRLIALQPVSQGNGRFKCQGSAGMHQFLLFSKDISLFDFYYKYRSIRH